MRFPFTAYRETIVADPPAGGAPAPSPDWRASLPEHYEVKDDKGAISKIALRGDPTLGRYKTGEEAARALIEQHKALSTAGKIPGADAKPEEVRAFWDKLGVPKDVAGYSAVKAPQVDGVTFSEEGLTAFYQNVALREGMTPKQVQAAVNFLGEWNGQQQARLRDGWINAQEDLRKEWGLNFDRNITIARRGMDHALKAAGADDLREALTSIEEHPAFLKFAVWIGRNLSEDGIVPGSVDGAHDTSALDAKIAELSSKLGTVPKSSPQYATMLAEYEAALKARHGTEEKGATAPK